MVRYIHRETGLDNLCMAGGVALNCVANGRVIRETPMKNLFVQPAAGDAGGAVGVAHYLYNTIEKQPRGKALDPCLPRPRVQATTRSGRTSTAAGAKYHDALRRASCWSRRRGCISEGNVIGWFQGRMEFGPRALGRPQHPGRPARPQDARHPEHEDQVPRGLPALRALGARGQGAEWFEIDCDSPYMLLVAQVREGKRVIPSVTHVDNSARLQTVTRDESPLYYDLIAEFERLTGVPIVINTSFNVRGEPIVCTPHDAYLCFMRTNMDQLVLGPLPPRQEGAAAAARRRRLADLVRAGLKMERTAAFEEL